MKQQSLYDIMGKQILEENLYLGPLEIMSEMAFKLPVITCPAGGYK